MDVRPCQPSDLDALQSALPLHGDYGHAYRLREQQAGRWLYLVATEDGRPLGSCVVHWDGPTNEAVREQIPHCVEIVNAFVVVAERGRGTGTALLSGAERHAEQRGHRRIGLGVADQNTAARRLYERCGYRDSGVRFRSSYEYVDAAGASVHEYEEGDFLIKDLDQPGTSP